MTPLFIPHLAAFGRRSALALLCSLLLAADAEAQILRVTRNVNLRHSPSTELPAIRLLTPPDSLIPLDVQQTAGYYPVLTEVGEEGWVWARNVVLEELPPIPAYTRADWRHWSGEDRA